MFQKTRNIAIKYSAAVALAVPMLAHATSVYDPLTSAVSVTDIIAALFAVAAIVALLPVARSGIKAVLRSLHF